jgi:hypothetical protein
LQARRQKRRDVLSSDPELPLRLARNKSDRLLRILQVLIDVRGPQHCLLELWRLVIEQLLDRLQEKEAAGFFLSAAKVVRGLVKAGEERERLWSD